MLTRSVPMRWFQQAAFNLGRRAVHLLHTRGTLPMKIVLTVYLKSHAAQVVPLRTPITINILSPGSGQWDNTGGGWVRLNLLIGFWHHPRLLGARPMDPRDPPQTVGCEKYPLACVIFWFYEISSIRHCPVKPPCVFVVRHLWVWESGSRGIRRVSKIPPGFATLRY